MSKQLRKHINDQFIGRPVARFRFSVLYVTHSWIELCKEPFPTERIADIGKYILGIGIPLTLLVLLEWGCSGSFL